MEELLSVCSQCFTLIMVIIGLSCSLYGIIRFIQISR